MSPVSAMLNTATEESKDKCKVLMVNGSPRPDGNTFCCLQEIETTLQKHGVEAEIVQIGRKPIRMCINCGGCHQNNGKGLRAVKSIENKAGKQQNAPPGSGGEQMVHKKADCCQKEKIE